MILCSGEKYDEPISELKCLACAIKHEGYQPCGFGYRLLRSIFSTKQDRTNEIHVTDLTGCLRRSYYDKVEPAPQYVHELLYIWMGVAVHKFLDCDDDHVKSEIPVEKYGIMGTLDAEYEDGRIEDVKTTRWMNTYNLPYGSHEDQVNFYRILRDGGGERLQIQMIDMTGPTRCRKCKVVMQKIDGLIQCPQCGHSTKSAHLGATLIEIPVQEDTEQYMVLRADALKQAIENKRTPEAESGYLCGYCAYKQCTYHPLGVVNDL